MTILEIVLLVCGVICVILSFVLTSKENSQSIQAEINTELTTQQKDEIKQQINDIVKEELEDINERTEASLDKISNTKILEMNEYAETIMGEINRNHNETVFLYDMLNEKAKEIKTTVKDVNLAKRQVEKIQSEVTLSSEGDTTDEEAATQETKKSDKTVRDDAKERLSELVRQSNEKAKKLGDGATRSHQAVKLDDMVKDSKINENKPKQVKTDNQKEKDSDSVNNKKINEVEKSDKVVKQDNSDELSKPNLKTGKVKKSVHTKADQSTSDEKKSLKNADKGAIDTKKLENKITEEVTKMNIQFDKGANNNEKILKLYSMGMSNKDIAKELGLGIGEVKLVIDLYNSAN